MKKKYIQPEMNVIVMQHTTAIMAGSVGSVTDKYSEATQLSRESDCFWDDNDE